MVSKFKARIILSLIEGGNDVGTISLIPYTGGKYRLVKELVPIIEWCADKHKLSGYMEICGGGGRMLLNIPTTKFQYRLYNDMSLGLSRLFACLGDTNLTRYMINKLLKIEYTSENFDKAKRLYDEEEVGSVTSAAYTFLLACQSRAGNMQSFNKNRLHSNKKDRLRYYRRVYGLHTFHNILNGVDIYNGDGLDILEEYLQRSDYFVYIDPPYVDTSKKSKNKSYKYDDFNHERMVDLLLKTKMKVMLSGYEKNHTYYDRLNKSNGWHKVFIKELFVSSSAKAGNTAEEFVWINFRVPKYILTNQK